MLRGALAGKTSWLQKAGSPRWHYPRAFQTQASESEQARKSLLEQARKSLLEAARPSTFLFIGNPGTGKSTLLNSLIGKVVFKSGVSYGHGMTFRLNRHAQNGNTFMDTPGLADVQLRKQAAAAITEALRTGGRFKIVFVMTLDSGRLRAEDKATMQLVLDSAPIENYGIVFNKIGKQLRDKLIPNTGTNENKDPSPMEKIAAQLFAGSRATEHIILNLRDSELEDADNALVPLTPPLCSFLRELPPTHVQTEAVKNIEVDRHDELVKKFDELLQKYLMNQVLATLSTEVVKLVLPSAMKRLQKMCG